MNNLIKNLIWFWNKISKEAIKKNTCYKYLHNFCPPNQSNIEHTEGFCFFLA